MAESTMHRRLVRTGPELRLFRGLLLLDGRDPESAAFAFRASAAVHCTPLQWSDAAAIADGGVGTASAQCVPLCALRYAAARVGQ